MQEIGLNQGTPDWLAWRAGDAFTDLLGVQHSAINGQRITATAASVCGGKSPFSTPHQLWQEMLGRRKRVVASFAMQRGSDMEPRARAAFIDIIGEEYEPVCVQSTVEPWIAASLDGIDMLRSRGVEIKCPMSARVHDMAVFGTVPEYYYDQIQWQMLATDNQVTEIDYFSYAPQLNGTPALITVKQDPIRQAELIQAVTIFRLAVMTGVPLSGSEFEQAGRVFLMINRQMTKLEIQLEQAKATLKKLANGKPAQGGGAMVTVSSSDGRVSWEKVALDLASKLTITTDELDVIKNSNKGKPSTTISVKEAADADMVFKEVSESMTSDISTAAITDQDKPDQPAPVW